MKKVLTIVLLLGLWSAQGQEIVRRNGEAVPGTEINSLGTIGGLNFDIEEWRFGLQVNGLLVDEIDPSYNVGEEMILVSPQLSASKRLDGTNYFAKGTVGYAQNIFDQGSFGMIGASIRWDIVNRDFLIFERTVGVEWALDAYFGSTTIIAPGINAYFSAQIGEILLIDVTSGVSYCQPASYSEPATMLKAGVGLNFGGGIRGRVPRSL